MKKTFLLFLIILCLKANAQVGFGAKGGFNLSTLSNIDLGSNINGSSTKLNRTKMKPGGHIGLYANFHLSKIFGFQPEVFFSMKGCYYEYTVSQIPSPGGPVDDIYLKTNLRQNYIEVPLQLRVNPSDNFYMLVGPYLGVFINGNSTTVSTQGNYSWTDNYKLTYHKQLELGLTYGIGFQTKKGFTAGLKYSRGLINNILDETFTKGNERKNINSTFQVFVGYEFTKKKKVKDATS